MKHPMTHSGHQANLTNSIQDYLKIIFELSEGGKAAATTVIAARLGVSPASVTGMVQKLAALRPALVSYRKHQGVRLTADGRRSALEVIRHHRLLETWLVQTLGYSWDEVHGEAEKLEHVMSDDLERRIARALGNPVRDPHGELIPTADLSMPAERSIALSDLRDGQTAIVRRVDASDAAALRQLNALGVHIGAKIRVMSLSDYDRVAILSIRGNEHEVTLGPALAERVYVEKTTKLA